MPRDDGDGDGEGRPAGSYRDCAGCWPSFPPPYYIVPVRWIGVMGSWARGRGRQRKQRCKRETSMGDRRARRIKAQVDGRDDVNGHEKRG